MRCPKCRTIVAEYHTSCPICQNNLIEIGQTLGPFYEPHPEAFEEWFKILPDDTVGPVSEADLPWGGDEDTQELDILLEEDQFEGSPLADSQAQKQTEAPDQDHLLSEETGEEEFYPEETAILDDLSGEEGLEILEAESLEKLEGVEAEGLEADHLAEIEAIAPPEGLDLEAPLAEENLSFSESEGLEEIPDLGDLLPEEFTDDKSEEPK